MLNEKLFTEYECNGRYNHTFLVVDNIFYFRFSCNDVCLVSFEFTIVTF